MQAATTAHSYERYNLAALARQLRHRFGVVPVGYVPGKTRFRDELMCLLGISAIQAEQLVDEMQSRGFLRYSGSPRRLDVGDAPWFIDEAPACVR